MGFPYKGKGTAAPKAPQWAVASLQLYPPTPLAMWDFPAEQVPAPRQAPLSQLRRPPTCGEVAPSHLERADSRLATALSIL